MRNDPEVEAIAMQWVLDYEHQRGWQPHISKDRDGGISQWNQLIRDGKIPSATN